VVRFLVRRRGGRAGRSGRLITGLRALTANLAVAARSVLTVFVLACDTQVLLGPAPSAADAPAALDLGQPRLRPADQPGKHGLRQAAPPPGPRDPLPGRLPVRGVHAAPALIGSAPTTSRQSGSLRSYGASGSNNTRTPMPRSVCRLAVNAGWLASWGLQ
jgi:hypothetical protein